VLRVTGAFVGLVGTFVLAVSSAPADAATTCSSALANATVAGPLFVPRAAACDLSNVIVDGSVVVQPGARLQSRDSTIHGSLSSDGATTQVCGGAIDNSVSVVRTPATGGGSYLAGQPFPGFCNPLTIGGSVTFARNASPALEIAGVVVEGSVVVTGSRLPHGPIVIGGNTVGRSMVVANNRIDGPPGGGIGVGFNQVAQTLACLNNDAFFSGFNTAHTLIGQCRT
jgi:hypothetical protein